MSTPITCATCKHFRPDPNNPTAAMGRCLHVARHGMWHANAPHRCKDHEAKPEKPAHD
ncbi:MAG: hypothetical protein ACREPQ_09715 [Rhodanobacter sp.]